MNAEKMAQFFSTRLPRYVHDMATHILKGLSPPPEMEMAKLLGESEWIHVLQTDDPNLPKAVCLLIVAEIRKLANQRSTKN